MIKIEHLTKSYADSTPLRDVSAEIRKGDVISVIGPSGTGKSTLLRCINRLETPTSGRIWIGEDEITSPKCDINRVRRRLGMVFQHFNLFGHLTVIENIMFTPVKLKLMGRQEAYDRGMELLQSVRLAGKAARYPDELSGGQQQRVAIVRSLAMDPEIILFDEPTSALDPGSVGEVELVIRDLAESGKTLMIVTHEMAFARSICNRVFYMDEGGIHEEGTPGQIFENPQKEKTRRFIRNLSVFELTVDSKEFDYYDGIARLDVYCNRHQIAVRLKYKIHLIFEELVKETLLPRMQNQTILFMAEYNPGQREAVIDVQYSGPALDLEADETNLSLRVITGIAAKLTQERSTSGGDSNRIRILLN